MALLADVSEVEYSNYLDWREKYESKVCCYLPGHFCACRL